MWGKEVENTISSRPGFLIVALSTFWTDMSLLCGVVFCFYIGFFVCLFKNVVNYHKRWLKPHVVFWLSVSMVQSLLSGTFSAQVSAQG
jgi:hypothetical protein